MKPDTCLRKPRMRDCDHGAEGAEERDRLYTFTDDKDKEM